MSDSNFSGDMLVTDPKTPLRLVIVIDNNEAAEFPECPWTLNASVGEEPAVMTELYFDGEGCLIEGEDVPAQLRILADMIDQGRVTR